jgi:hypothetical protein
MQAGAQERLAGASFVPISRNDAQALVREVIPDSSSRLFLLRALEYPRYHGKFDVRERDGKVSITFATLGVTPPDAKRVAIVAQLNREPTDVFVGCAGAL